MLYLLDANVLIVAHNYYYPIDRVPEFWEWLLHVAEKGRVKIPVEMAEEIKEGRKDDLLRKWISNSFNSNALLLREEIEPDRVQTVVRLGYAPDLTDIELDQIGRDPFLVAYALGVSDRCVVTTEVSKPKRSRQNRKLPDVCSSLGVSWCDPFELYAVLGFKTAWRSDE